MRSRKSSGPAATRSPGRTLTDMRKWILQKKLTPAILSYDGIQYTYMAPAVFEDGQYDYVQEHLRILSAFYGVVRPMDGVVPYRLEMQAKAAVGGHRNLYDFWGDSLYREVTDDSRIIINLASREYSRCIEKYLQPDDRFITCVFGEEEKGRIVQKGVYAKMARGQMVRYMAANAITEPEQIKAFDWSGYRFREDLSSDAEYVFARTEEPGKPGLFQFAVIFRAHGFQPFVAGFISFNLKCQM